MDTNIKLKKLEESTLKINTLIEQLKDDLLVQQNKNKQLKKLKNHIYDYTHENDQHFTTSYNVGRLKSIIQHMFEIIQNQDKRISELERK